MAVRIDQRLVELGLARSRAQAQALIQNGCVTLMRPATAPANASCSTKATKASQRVGPDVRLLLSGEALRQPVSRAAFKIDALIDAANLSLTGALCVDAGQSTGGFSERLLQHDAAYVLGVEVGHGQLAASLRTNPRIGCLEHTNIKACTRETLAAFLLAENQSERSNQMAASGADLVCADLSFISLRKVLPTLAALLADDGNLFALVKPQFELGPGAVNKRGVITDLSLLGDLRDKFEQALTPLGLGIIQWLTSPIAGSDGNTEFLLHARSIPINPAH